MSMYTFIHNLLNVLVQIANKMGFKRKKSNDAANKHISAATIALQQRGCFLFFIRSLRYVTRRTSKDTFSGGSHLIC
jgi:hypothetical protein